MKYYFIINPIAGGKNSTPSISEKLVEYCKSNPIDYEEYITKCPGDAMLKVNEIAKNNEELDKPNDICFVACGGDGTCHEVATGIALHKHCSLAVLPVGSCNDFLKTFPKYDFMSFDDLFHGTEKKIDLFKVNEEYCLNVTNVGYDAKVNADQIKFRIKDKSIKKAYYHAIVVNLFKHLGDETRVFVDNKEIFKGKSLLITMGNGRFYGSCFECAPAAEVDDGLLDVSVVKKVSILKFASLIKYYKRGEQLERKEFKKVITYVRGKNVKIISPSTLCYCIDGETFYGKELDVCIYPHQLSFIFPRRNYYVEMKQND